MDKLILQPIVSIVLATYNRAAYLPQAIRSVLAQTCQNWELLIIDDGSNDATATMIQSWTSDRRIKYFKRPYLGNPQTVNFGFQAAQGKFVTLLDSDDRYTPKHLEQRLKIMARDTQVDMLYGGLRIIGNPYVVDKYDPNQWIHLSQCFCGGTYFGRRQVFLDLGGFQNLDYGADSEFMERVIAAGYRVKKVGFPTYVYDRTTPDSITNLMAAARS